MKTAIDEFETTFWIYVQAHGREDDIDDLLLVDVPTFFFLHRLHFTAQNSINYAKLYNILNIQMGFNSLNLLQNQPNTSQQNDLKCLPLAALSNDLCDIVIRNRDDIFDKYFLFSRNLYVFTVGEFV